MKRIIVITLIAGFLAFIMGATQTTRVSSYRLIDTSDVSAGNESVFGDTDYGFGSPSTYDIDLLDKAGAGSNTYANLLSFIFACDGAENETATVVIYGAPDGGPWEPVASLDLTVGTANSVSGYDWVDTISVTEYTPISTSSSSAPENAIARFTMDATGYRYITVKTTAHTIDGNAVKTWVRWY